MSFDPLYAAKCIFIKKNTKLLQQIKSDKKLSQQRMNRIDFDNNKEEHLSDQQYDELIAEEEKRTAEFQPVPYETDTVGVE